MGHRGDPVTMGHGGNRDPTTLGHRGDRGPMTMGHRGDRGPMTMGHRGRTCRRAVYVARRAVVTGHTVGMAVVDVRLGRRDGEACELHRALGVLLSVALGLGVTVGSLHSAPTVGAVDTRVEVAAGRFALSGKFDGAAGCRAVSARSGRAAVGDT